MADVWLPDDEPWRCQEHPSVGRRTGVCPHCLRLRLLRLCPLCASDRPCACSSSSSSASSSSNSTSTSSSSLDRPISFFLRHEPPFQRSRSSHPANPPYRPWSSFLWPFRSRSKTNNHQKKLPTTQPLENPAPPTLPRSRSVGFALHSPFPSAPPRLSCSSEARGKAKLWYFPSPMKAFSRIRPKQDERSPFWRG